MVDAASRPKPRTPSRPRLPEDAYTAHRKRSAAFNAHSPGGRGSALAQHVFRSPARIPETDSQTGRPVRRAAKRKTLFVIARGGISWAEFARPDKIDWLACRRSRHHALGHVCRFRGSRRRDPRHLGARGRGVGRHCRLFPGITDNVRARECARTIAGWKPLPAAACQISRSRLRRNRARLTKP